MYGKITVNLWLCILNVVFSLFFHSEVGHVYSDMLSYIKRVYVNKRLHTTMYNILRQDVQQCITMFDNVRQCTTENDFLTTVFLSHPKVLHVKLFF